MQHASMSQLIPIVFGLLTISFSLFAPMNRLRDGTRITNSRQRLAWRGFFFLMGVLTIVVGSMPDKR